MCLDDKFQDENMFLHIMTASELNSYVISNQFIKRIETIKQNFPGKEMYLVILGLKEFCRNNRENAGRFAIETALTELQLLHGISHRLSDTAEDVVQIYLMFSKSIAEIPFK